MIPITIDGPEAARRAAQELLDPIYAQAEPPWWQQAVQWLWERIGRAIAELAGAVGGNGWLVVVLALVVLAAVVWVRRTGGLRSSARSPGQVFEGRPQMADDHRQAAEAARMAGDMATAVAERFKAVVRELEQRGIIDVVPGRTADEVAYETGRVCDDRERCQHIASAAGTFDAVVYGKRPATDNDYQVIVRADQAALVLRIAPSRLSSIR